MKYLKKLEKNKLNHIKNIKDIILKMKNVKFQGRTKHIARIKMNWGFFV